MDDLAGVDLNLLVVLNALLDERHVTRAGRKIGLSQPATSNVLKRLRSLFSDPLLTRVGSQMELTPRAVALQEPVRVALAAVRDALADPTPFDPTTVHARIRIATTDHVLLLVLPQLQRILASEDPGIELRFSSFGILDDVELLRTEQVDLLIGSFQMLPPQLRRQHLFSDEVVCLLRVEHPAIPKHSKPGDPLDLDAFLAYPHLRIAPIRSRAGRVAEALSDLRVDRFVACELPGFLAAPFLIESTDLITVLSSRVADRFTPLLNVTTRRPPLDVAGFETDMVWHSRSDGVPVEQWVRGRVAEIAAGIAES